MVCISVGLIDSYTFQHCIIKTRQQCCNIAIWSFHANYTRPLTPPMPYRSKRIWPWGENYLDFSEKSSESVGERDAIEMRWWWIERSEGGTGKWLCNMLHDLCFLVLRFCTPLVGLALQFSTQQPEGAHPSRGQILTSINLTHKGRIMRGGRVSQTAQLEKGWVAAILSFFVPLVLSAQLHCHVHKLSDTGCWCCNEKLGIIMKSAICRTRQDAPGCGGPLTRRVQMGPTRVVILFWLLNSYKFL